MGAEFIASYAFAKKSAKLNWEAGKALVPELTDDELTAFAEYRADPFVDTDDEVELEEARTGQREEILRLVDILRESIERDYGLVDTPDDEWTLYLAGGTSYGGSPNEEFDAINDLWAVPRVLAAIGFYTWGVS